MNDSELALLRVLSASKAKLPAPELAEKAGISYSAAMSGLEALSQQGLVTIERQEKKRLELSEEGVGYAKNGLPELRLSKAVKKPVELSAAVAAAGLSELESRIALQWAMRNKLLATEKKDGKTLLVPAAKSTESLEQELLQALVRGKRIAGAAEENALSALVARGLVKELEEKSVFARITAKGAKAAEEEAGKVSQLTPQMLKTGEWKGKRFREYDLATVAAPMQVARKHVYKEFLNRVKLHLVGLGFKEMHGPLVELEFWNMDALFMPQDHPAREVHDIFSVKRGYPAAEVTDRVTHERVREAHERGVDGSIGWRYAWNPATAAQLVLRSHTTAVSARHLASGLPSPSKLFCIGRVFRPDEIDWKHFIEFNQCDGIVLGEDISFRELLGYLKAFAQEVFGAQKVRFNPTYFPFTEPSVELSVEIPGRGWAEVGGAGMFRPEMLRALGVNQPVIAWGLGIDRLAMLTLGITDIRELNSHKIDFLRSR